MAEPPSSRRLTLMQTVGIVTGALLVLCTAILVTLSLGGNLSLTLSGENTNGDAKKFRNITATDAQLTCENETRKEFGKRIKILSPDRHSSRYDEKANRYKMYFWLEVTDNQHGNNASSLEFFVNCYVHGSRGSVTHYSTLKKTEAKTEPSRRSEGGLFGY